MSLSERQRWFVRQYVAEVAVKPHGAQTRAARKAGYAGKLKNLCNQAYDLTNNPKIIAAIGEESKRLIHLGNPEAVAAYLSLIRDPAHKDHGRAVLNAIERMLPSTSHHNIQVTHRTVDPTKRRLRN